MTASARRIAFIGFGEAGQAIAAGLREEGVAQIAAWDILFPKAAGERLKRAASETGVRIAGSAEDAIRDADIVIAAVTAASSHEAAQSVARLLAGSPYYLDVNSVSPGRKRDTEALLSGKVRYVDVAILSPIHPARHKSPMLLSGPHAQALKPALDGLGMKVSVAGAATGAAAAIKMVRSVMVKGIEAVTLECFLAAARAGVVEEVAASLKNNYPTLDWGKVAEYNIERMASHGIRRAAEMEEVRRHLAGTRRRAADDAGNRAAPARDGRDRQAGRGTRHARPGSRQDARRDQHGHQCPSRGAALMARLLIIAAIAVAGAALAWASAPPAFAQHQPLIFLGPCGGHSLHPVCAHRKRALVTYANACLARQERAQVISQGACPAACPMVFQPVCAVDGKGTRKTYGNDCQARAEGASVQRRGRCIPLIR
jgi:3-hydroxyisobutyrate dehydrogenase-like beta-hydroxyacid dehydrogenase